MQFRKEALKENYFENHWSEYWIENGIIHQVFKPSTILTLDVGKKVIADRIKMTGPRIMPLLININYVLSIDFPTKCYMASAEAATYISACAFIWDNVLSRMHFNTFIRFTRQVIPIKGFTKEQIALDWLAHYKDHPAKL